MSYELWAVVFVRSFDLQLPVQSVPIATKVMISNPVKVVSGVARVGMIWKLIFGEGSGGRLRPTEGQEKILGCGPRGSKTPGNFSRVVEALEPHLNILFH